MVRTIARTLMVRRLELRVLVEVTVQVVIARHQVVGRGLVAVEPVSAVKHTDMHVLLVDYSQLLDM